MELWLVFDVRNEIASRQTGEDDNSYYWKNASPEEATVGSRKLGSAEVHIDLGNGLPDTTKNMCKELLLGTAVAPSHMYLFPLGIDCFIGTTGNVYSLKSTNNPAFLNWEC